MFQLRTYSI